MTAPWLMEADDGKEYIVKFANERQDNSIFGEIICSQLIKKLNITTPYWDFIKIDSDLIQKVPELVNRKIQAGDHFGTRYIQGSTNLPPNRFGIPLNKIVNANEIPLMIAFDIFICNGDRKDANGLIGPIDDARERLIYYMIDHGLAFNNEHWNAENLDSLPWREVGIPWNTENIINEKDFDDAITALICLRESDFREAVNIIPNEWQPNQEDLSKLIETLVNRNEDEVLNVLQGIKTRNNNVFPKWR